MEEKVKQLASFVQSALYFCNEAFNELWNITQTPSTEEEHKLASGPPFHFYGVTLQYCFIMEYTKLLDPRPSSINKNVASLFKLNESVYELMKDKYELNYLENKKLLEELCDSDLYKRLKDLRDKKFGHADNHSINDPFKIEGFSGGQIDEMKSQLNQLLYVVNNSIGELMNATFFLHGDTRTANFIKHHAKYKQYYFKNYMKAAEEGYGLH